jgi:lysophospholipase L1-like esterase
MDQHFWRGAAVSALILFGVGSVRVAERAALDQREADGILQAGLQALRNPGLNREDRERQTVGYYEGLLNEGSRVTSMGSLLTGQMSASGSAAGAARRIRALRQPEKYLVTRDFLYYVPRPHLDLPDYDDGVSRLVTNSAGMADREYAIGKPAGTRRIAVLGDSVTRGQGAPVGQSFEALFEDALNATHAGGDVASFEVLNFAVSGYRMTQVLDLALEKVPPYAPDVYMLALTELSISGRWGDHLQQLVADGVDLKYDFLRDLVRRSRLTSEDSPTVADAKLAPFRLDTVRWAIGTLRDHAKSRGATLVVLLVPTVREPASLRHDFSGVPELLADLHVPAIDLLDTFRDVPDPNLYRVSTENVHPNGAGHKRLFERLYDAVINDPESQALMLAPPRPDRSGL